LELRKYDRYQLGAPAVFEWEDVDGIEHHEEGTTRDISTTGLYLFSANCPPEGVEVKVQVSLPAMHASRPGWRLETEGKVIRVESSNGAGRKFGFALRSSHTMPRLKTRESV
jgi:hypothetical protein